MIGNGLLQNNAKWNPYTGQNLNLIDSAHIFVIRTDIYGDPAVYFANTLSGEELEKANRFFHASDRTNFIVRRALLRQLLGNALAVPPAGIQFQQGQHKKPTVEGIEFNVSHSRNYAVIAVSETALGIDIEYLDPGFAFGDIVAGHFSSTETSFVQEAENGLLNFYTIWTRKEALLKATGEGLTDNMDQIQVTTPTLFRKDSRYLLHSFMVNNHYLMSIASGYEPDQLKLWLIENPISF